MLRTIVFILLLISPPPPLSAQDTTSRTFELFLHEKGSLAPSPWSKEELAITVNKKQFDGSVTLEKVDRPLRIVLVIDTSGSTASRIGPLGRYLAGNIKNHTRPGDRVAVAGINDILTITSDFTDDFAKVRNAVLSLNVSGRSKLFGNLLQLAERLGKGKKTDTLFLFLSDGLDTLTKRPLDKASRDLALHGIPVFSFCVMGRTPEELLGCDNLRLLSKNTGGKSEPIDSEASFQKALQQFSMLRDSRYSQKLTVPGHVELKDVKIKSKRPKSEVLYTE